MFRLVTVVGRRVLAGKPGRPSAAVVCRRGRCAPVILPVEGSHLHVVDLGRGTPMLMHDGWVASWSLWLPLIEQLQDRWRCLAYDHRGTGARHELAVSSDWPQYVENFVAACLPEPDAGPLHRFGHQTLLPAGPEAAIRMTAVHAGLEPPLETVSVPTLVVHGALDAIALPEGAHELARWIPDAELVVVHDAGHVPVLTRPEVVASCVDDWWSRVTSG